MTSVYLFNVRLMLSVCLSSRVRLWLLCLSNNMRLLVFKHLPVTAYVCSTVACNCSCFLTIYACCFLTTCACWCLCVRQLLAGQRSDLEEFLGEVRGHEAQLQDQLSQAVEARARWARLCG